MRSMLKALAEVPGESLVYHAGRNHFSSWFKARTEFELASMLRPRRVTDFSSPSVLREYLINTLTDYLRAVQRHVVTEFDSKNYDEFAAFSKIGTGSLGGKGRGLAFMHKILSRTGPDLDNVEIAIPKTVVVASDVFEEFLEVNDLRSLVHYADAMSDQEVLDAFRNGGFPPGLRPELASFLELVGEPLAVRSSSILEDSVYQPFAGVYATVMLPNNHPSQDVRLAQLLEAVKVVYASTYFSRARDYLEMTPYRIEEESMAVLIQRLIGRQHGHRFYPTLSGVASSYNFYPFGDMNPADGVAQIALGLGKSVVEGFEALRFSPNHPQVLPQFSSVKDILRNAQRRFYSLDLNQIDVIPGALTDVNLLHEETMQAVHDGAAHSIASTYDRAGDRITTGLDEGGVPLITFKPILRKAHVLPLPEILTWLIETCQAGDGQPGRDRVRRRSSAWARSPQTFHVVQLRPMVIEEMDMVVSLDDERHEERGRHHRGGARTRAERVDLGHHRRRSRAHRPIADLRDRQEIETINRKLRKRTASASSSDRADGAREITGWEFRSSGRRSRAPAPSSKPTSAISRSNLPSAPTSSTTSPASGSPSSRSMPNRLQGWVNWDWLRAQTSIDEALDGGVRHLRLDSPVQVLVDGSSGHGVIRES